jgi:outer membrane cobalamin receptor
MSNTRKNPLISTVSLAFLAVLASDCAWSQGDEASEQSFAINKVLVSATRTESNVSESGRAVSVVEKEQLEVMQPQSVAQAVRYESNVTMTGGPRAGSQGVNIRGLSGSKVLQVVDGVRQALVIFSILKC